MITGKKKFLFYIILVFLVLSASALAMELALRLVYPLPWRGFVYTPPQQQLFQYDQELGWVGRPGTSAQFASTDFSVIVSNDLYGFRNTAPVFSPHKKNILICGDSFGWGWGVEQDEVVSAIMAKRRPDLNVYNLSVPGYGTGQEYLLLKRFLKDRPDYRPDGIVLLLVDNDFLDVVSKKRYGYPKPVFILRADGSLAVSNVPVPREKVQEFNQKRHNRKFAFPFWRHSHLCNLAAYVIRNKCFPHTNKSQANKRPLTIDEKSQVALTAKLLEEINREAKARDAFFLVVSIFAGQDGRLSALEAALKKANIPYSRYERSIIPLNELWVDRHLNAFGHRRLARAILQRVDTLHPKHPD